MDMSSEAPPGRIVALLPDPLGLYFRLGRNDHPVLAQLLSEERTAMTGIVFDAEYADVHQEIRRDVTGRKLDALVDTRLMEIATPGGSTSRRAGLTWGRARTAADFLGDTGRKFANSIAEFVVGKGFTGVLAPTHYLAGGANDPWFDIDQSFVDVLRNALLAYGGTGVEVHYPLALPQERFFDSAQRARLKASLGKLGVTTIWLRISPFGSHSGQLPLQRYIVGCRDFHELHVPLIADRAGSVGLPLLGFGAVGGIECGVTSGERFDVRGLARKRPGKGFAPHPRVYFPSLGVSLSVEQAKTLFGQPVARARYACRHEDCCRRGYTDMVSNPRRHFVLTRIAEVRALDRVPQAHRAAMYLNDTLGETAESLARALNLRLERSTLRRLANEQRRCDGRLKTLTKMALTDRGVTYSPVPVRRSLRQRGAS